VVGLVLLPGRALAAQLVTAQPSNTFTPSTQTVPLNDTVSFTNAGGTHNVGWDDRGVRTAPSIDGSDPPWPFMPKRTFSRPGLYRFYCSVHGGPGGEGMSGRITVLNANGTVPRRPAIGRIATATGRGRVTLRFTSSTSGAVTGKVSRKQGRSFRRFGSLRLTLRKGRNALTVTRVSSGKRLTAGSYRLALTFSDGISNLTTGKTLNFTISR